MSNGNLVGASTVAFVVFFLSISLARTTTASILFKSSGKRLKDIPIPSGYVRSKHICGNVETTSPPLACTPLQALAKSDIALIRGENCSYITKLQNAQSAKYHAAIIYGDVVPDSNTSMSYHLSGVSITSVFVSTPSGFSIIQQAGNRTEEICLLPDPPGSLWVWLFIVGLSVVFVIWIRFYNDVLMGV